MTGETSPRCTISIFSLRASTGVPTRATATTSTRVTNNSFWPSFMISFPLLRIFYLDDGGWIVPPINILPSHKAEIIGITIWLCEDLHLLNVWILKISCVILQVVKLKWDFSWCDQFLEGIAFYLVNGVDTISPIRLKRGQKAHGRGQVIV